MNAQRPTLAVTKRDKPVWIGSVTGFLTAVGISSFWFYRITTTPVPPDADDSSSPLGNIFGGAIVILVVSFIGVFGAVAGALFGIIISKFLPQSHADSDAP